MSYEWLRQQIQACSFAKKFQITSIPTYNLFRSNQLDSLSSLTIQQQCFKELVSDTLKLCYLYDPIMATVAELNKKPRMSSYDSKQQSDQYNPNQGISVGMLLRILHEDLFYENMVKIKIELTNTDSQFVTHLVNNRPTHVNKRVIISALVLLMSKKMTSEDIGTCLLMFNLEESLLKMSPYGLPLEFLILQKYVRKLERIINANDLKRFIYTAKQINDEQNRMNKQMVQGWITEPKSSNTIGPDQFLFLIAMAEKKNDNSNYFFNPIGKKKQGIEIFIEMKNNENLGIESVKGRGSAVDPENLKNGLHFTQQFSNSRFINSNNGAHKENKVFLGEEQKVRGLSLLSKKSAEIQKIEHSKKVYQQIKNHLIMKASNKSLTQLKVMQNEQNGEFHLSENQKNHSHFHKRTKSLALQKQLSKNVRPTSAIFKNSMKILVKNQKNEREIQAAFEDLEKSFAPNSKFIRSLSASNKNLHNKLGMPFHLNNKNNSQIFYKSKGKQVRKGRKSNKSQNQGLSYGQKQKGKSRHKRSLTVITSKSKNGESMQQSVVIGNLKIENGFGGPCYSSVNIEESQKQKNSKQTFLPSQASSNKELQYMLNWGIRRKQSSIFQPRSQLKIIHGNNLAKFGRTLKIKKNSAVVPKNFNLLASNVYKSSTMKIREDLLEKKNESNPKNWQNENPSLKINLMKSYQQQSCGSHLSPKGLFGAKIEIKSEQQNEALYYNEVQYESGSNVGTETIINVNFVKSGGFT